MEGELHENPALGHAKKGKKVPLASLKHAR